MKILITGAKGLLGSNLSLMYSDDYEVIATGIDKPAFNFCRNYKLDITNEEDLKIIEKERPNLLINCVALTDVDFCEENPQMAEKINSEGAKNLAEICRKVGCYFVQVSTDSIFDGEKGNYSEGDKVNPQNIYAKTKLEAEKFVQEVMEKNYCIIRTNLYGWNHFDKFSIAEWMLDKFRKDEEFKAFQDIIFSPVLTTNLGRAILELYYKRYSGIINIASPEKISKLNFARRIAKIFGKKEELIEPAISDDFGFKAKRPKKTDLNIGKAAKILDTKLLDINDGLKEFKSLGESEFLKKLKSQ